jgi:hypothetical protein
MSGFGHEILDSGFEHDIPHHHQFLLRFQHCTRTGWAGRGRCKKILSCRNDREGRHPLLLLAGKSCLQQ